MQQSAACNTQRREARAPKLVHHVVSVPRTVKVRSAHRRMQHHADTAAGSGNGMRPQTHKWLVVAFVLGGCVCCEWLLPVYCCNCHTVHPCDTKVAQPCAQAADAQPQVHQRWLRQAHIPCGWDAEIVECLRCNVLSDARAQHCAAVCKAAVGCLACSLQLQFPASVIVHDFTEGDGSPIAKLTSPIAKLVAAVVLQRGRSCQWSHVQVTRMWQDCVEAPASCMLQCKCDAGDASTGSGVHLEKSGLETEAPLSRQFLSLRTAPICHSIQHKSVT
jgi:hypothetical protein